MIMKESETQEYAECFWCDNIVSYGTDGLIGLLHLGFPRCFILIRDLDGFEFSDFDGWRENLADIQWLDSNDRGTPQEREAVIVKLWNFSVLYDRMNEEEYYDELIADYEERKLTGELDED